MIYYCLNSILKPLVPSFNNFRQKFFNKKIAATFFASLAFVTCANAYDFNCDSVYGIMNTPDNKSSKVYQYKSMTSANINSGDSAFIDTGIIFTELSQSKPTPDNFANSTLAIGYGPDSSNIRVYRWKYHDWTTYDNNASISKRISYFITPVSLDNITLWAFNYNSANAPKRESAGGEVNQLTGDLYLSSAWNDKLSDGSFKITVIDGSKRTTRSLSFSKEDDSEPDLGQAVSDMIIDAEGNTFIIATDGTSNYLTRLNMTTGKYDTVVEIKGAFGNPSLITAGGMAFLNGRVYVLGGGKNYEIDPVSGQSADIGNGYNFTDLASCQLVPLITGQVYNDANGDGALSDSEKVSGIAGVTVQLYDKNYNLLGEQTTKDSGSYSFIVNDIKGAEFYIRVKNPTINGEHAAQTWASGGSFSYKIGGTNIVTNYCTDLTSDDSTGSDQDRVCYGKRADSIDSLDNGVTNANYYSKVFMDTDKAVVHANFAFTAILDRSDAPASYGEAIHNLGIKDSSGNLVAYLGNGVSADSALKTSDNASGDDFDDGMFITIDGVELPLQNAVLMTGKTYNMRALINGTLKSSAYLNAWIGTKSGGEFSNTFDTQIADNLNSASDDTIEFTYSPKGNAAAINTFIRARFSTVKNLSAADNVDTKDYPWSFDGEVEDYRVVIAGKQIRLNVKSVNDIGNFSFNLSNVDATFPSINTRTFETTTSDVFTIQPYDGTVHAIKSASQDVVISGSSIPSQFELMRSQTNCVDLSSSNPSANLNIDFNANGDITVQGDQVADGSNIVCSIVYGVRPTLEFVTNIANRAFANDNFNISISDVSNVSLKSNQTMIGESSASINAFGTATGTYLFNQTMASGSIGSLEHYKKDIKCTNSKDSSTVTTSGVFPFEINATYDDIIKCEITNIGLTADLKTSEIKAEPSTQTAGDNSTITVTLKDSSGNVINSGGDDVVIFMNANDAMTLTNGAVSKISATANVTAVDNGNGTHTAYVHSTVAGLANMTFTVNGDLGENNTSVEFTHSNSIDINGGNTSITANPTHLSIDEKSVITVVLVD
ncbi:MAG: hypothetical protein LBL65_00985, partial [Campylobacteraceae bacterium]|nr:hypothetical protein [Campylobacteraceae bacterium]